MTPAVQQFCGGTAADKRAPPTMIVMTAIAFRQTRFMRVVLDEECRDQSGFEALHEKSPAEQVKPQHVTLKNVEWQHACVARCAYRQCPAATMIANAVKLRASLFMSTPHKVQGISA